VSQLDLGLLPPAPAREPEPVFPTRTPSLAVPLQGRDSQRRHVSVWEHDDSMAVIRAYKYVGIDQGGDGDELPLPATRGFPWLQNLEGCPTITAVHSTMNGSGAADHRIYECDQCGIYAYADQSYALKHQDFKGVLVEIACWGDIVHYSLGLRTQRAKVAGVVLQDCRICRRPGTYTDCQSGHTFCADHWGRGAGHDHPYYDVELLAQSWGVPVLRKPSTAQPLSTRDPLAAGHVRVRGLQKRGEWESVNFIVRLSDGQVFWDRGNQHLLGDGRPAKRDEVYGEYLLAEEVPEAVRAAEQKVEFAERLAARAIERVGNARMAMLTEQKAVRAEQARLLKAAKTGVQDSLF